MKSTPATTAYRSLPYATDGGEKAGNLEP